MALRSSTESGPVRTESRQCTVDGCDGKIYKNGYCVEHFVQYSSDDGPKAASSSNGSSSSSSSSAAAAPAASAPKSGNKFANFGGGGQPCTICTKIVYPAETIQFEMKPYHIDCFKCIKCSKKLDAPQGAIFENIIYCKMCFQREGLAQKQTQVKWTPKTTTTTTSSYGPKLGGGGTPCTVCSKTVYAGEAVQFEMKIYHPKCITCADCSKECSSNEISQFEGKLYCKRCWEKGGYARKQLATTQKPGSTKAGGYNPRFANLGGGGQKCFSCQLTVYPAETLQYESRPYHIKCFKCSHCKIEIQQVARAEAKEDKIYCQKCFHELGLYQPTLKEKH